MNEKEFIASIEALEYFYEDKEIINSVFNQLFVTDSSFSMEMKGVNEIIKIYLKNLALIVNDKNGWIDWYFETSEKNKICFLEEKGIKKKYVVNNPKKLFSIINKHNANIKSN